MRDPGIFVDLLLRTCDLDGVPTVSTVTEINRESRETVARNMTLARERAGYSKRRLAREAGVHEYQLRHWEGAQTEPSARNLLKIAIILGQSLEWFYANHDGEAPDG